MINLARLFAYTRHIESLLALERAERQRDVDRLRADLEEERAERRRLQDRLLQKSGVMPVFEQPAQRDPSKPTVITTDREKAVVERGKRAAQAMKDQIKGEIQQYVESQRNEGG